MEPTNLNFNVQMEQGLALVVEKYPPDELGDGDWLRAIRIYNLGPHHCLMLGSFVDMESDGETMRTLLGDLEHVLAPGESRLIMSVDTLNDKLAAEEPEKRSVVTDNYENTTSMRLSVQVVSATNLIRVVGKFRPKVSYGVKDYPFGRIGLGVEEGPELRIGPEST